MRRPEYQAAILVGKNSLLREGVAEVLRAANFRILATVFSAQDLIDRKMQLQQPLFLVVHTDDNFEVTAEQIEILRDSWPEGRISVVANRCQLGNLLPAFRAGVNAFFFSVTTHDVFIKSIELVMMGETVVPVELLPFVIEPEGDQANDAELRNDADEIEFSADRATVSQLSPRERLILRHLVEGDTNKSIARKIDVTEATVKVHVKGLLRKIRVRNRTQAAIWGINHRRLVRTNDFGSPPLDPGIDRELPPAVPINHEVRCRDLSTTVTKGGTSRKG